MRTAGAILTVANIPLIWRFRMTMHGVRVSWVAHDDRTAIGGEQQATYRVMLADGDLIGGESAPLEVRVNIRAASFVLRVFDQHFAEIHADSSGALLAVRVAHGRDIAVPAQHSLSR
jgi:hypothetical protein